MAGPGRGHDPGVSAGRGAAGELSGPWCDRRRSALGRHDSRFTSAFEDTAAWLACHTMFSVLAALLRITWRSVAAIITRVVAARAAQSDRLTGLRRIGVDEISYRKGHRYLLCVVDHDTGGWCGPPRAVTPRPCGGSSMPWERTAARC